MQALDYLILIAYFVILMVIGYIAARRIKKQEDFFMGGRGFGKMLQTFAAFGAGTGSSDPVNTARGVFVSGMSGMWSVMYWLFVTPFYWITGVWYRRMRHLTLGDWYVERYESKALGAGYAFFGILFMMVYGSMLFSAIGKVAAPLIGVESVVVGGQAVPLEYVLVPIIGLVVLVYGIAGGLHAAYYTDVIQGICIILLSIVLIPFGLRELVGDSAPLADGFKVMHENIPPTHFDIIGSTSNSEFPWFVIVAVVVINLVGIVVQPHFIATGGGSAKTEMNARVGLVTGNFLKRFCTIGWVITALIVLAKYSGEPALVEDPDKVWGVATMKILGPLNAGLVGLMLACLLAALMSSVDAYMVVGAGLVVRNFYAAYVNRDGSEREYLMVGRVTGVLIVFGAVLVSLYMMDVFKQLQLTWIFPVVFAAPFWVGMYWRRATLPAAWLTVLFNVLFFFGLPNAIPWFNPDLRTDSALTQISDIKRTTTKRPAAESDVRQRTAYLAERKLRVEAYGEAETAYRVAYPGADVKVGASLDGVKELEPVIQDLLTAKERLDAFPLKPELEVGKEMTVTKKSGGKAIFWRGSVSVTDEEGKPVEPKVVEDSRVETTDEAGNTIITETLRYPEQDGLTRTASGTLSLDLLIFSVFPMDLTKSSDPWLQTLEFPAKIVLPFLVMIFSSLLTRPNSTEALDRYYCKMKTPVDPHPERDAENLESAYADREQLEAKKLFPNTNLEFQKPTAVDIIGFVISFLICFAIIGLAFWVAQLGAS